MKPVRVVEFVFLILLAVYFLTYERDTLSDCVVCSSLSVLLWLFASQLALPTPDKAAYGPKDTILASIALLAFVLAWSYGFLMGKVNATTAPKSLVITLVYVYYALIQHFLVQRYLAVRVYQFYIPKGKASAASRTAWTVAIGFAVLHLPYPHLILPAFLIGLGFVYYYLTTGRLWAVVLSHALMASTALYWYLDDNPFTELYGVVSYLGE